MSEKSIKFRDEKVNKRSFYKNKKTFKVEDIDINKILVSKKESFEKKLNILLNIMMMMMLLDHCVKPPKMIWYVKHFKNGNTINKTMSFKAANNKILKKYIKIWENISSLLNKEFDSEPVYGENQKYIKSKIKSYENNIQTDFHKKGVPRENIPCNCLFVIKLESVSKIGKKILSPNIFRRV